MEETAEALGVMHIKLSIFGNMVIVIKVHVRKIEYQSYHNVITQTLRTNMKKNIHETKHRNVIIHCISVV